MVQGRDGGLEVARSLLLRCMCPALQTLSGGSAASAQLWASRKGRTKERPPGRGKGRPHHLLLTESWSMVSLVSYPMFHPFKRSHKPFPLTLGLSKPQLLFARGWLLPPLPLLLQPRDKLWFLLPDGLSQPWIQEAVANPPSWDSPVQERPNIMALASYCRKR